MNEARKRVGRPRTGLAFNERLMVYDDAAGMARLQALADKWGISRAAAIRRAVAEAARREKIE